jgi:hypothetical protein
MATWIWLNLTLGILAFAAIGVVLPAMALRRPGRRPALAPAAGTRPYKLTGSRELAGAGV